MSTVKSGTQITIKVSPRAVSIDDAVQNVSGHKRNCNLRLDTTVNGSTPIIGVYSQAGCQFECMLREARSKCDCTPWDYPVEPGISLFKYNTYLLYYVNLFKKSGNSFKQGIDIHLYYFTFK